MTIALNWITINAILASISVVIMLGLAFYAWSRRDTVKGGYIFTLMLLFEAVRIAGYTLEIVSTDVGMALTASKIQYFGVFVVLLWFVFTLNFAGFGKFSARAGWILAIIPTVILMLALTDELHGLIWKNITLATGDAYAVFHAEYGSFFYVYFLFTMVLLVVGVILLVRAQIRQWKLFRSQIALWLAGTLIPAFGHYSMVFGWEPVPNLHPIPLTYMIGGVFLTIAVFRLRLIDVMPVPFDTIFESSPNPVIVYDLKRTVVAFNPTAAPFADSKNFNLIGSPLEVAFPALFKALGRDLDAIEIHLNDADYKVRIAPSMTRTGGVRGHILILTDITLIRQAELEQKALLDRISRLEALKSEMIRMGAHDLKDPLSSILGYLEVLNQQDAHTPLENLNYFLAPIQRATNKMLRITTDILSLDRIERMANEQNMQYVDLTPLVKEVVEESTFRASEKGLSYSLTIGDGTLSICGDPVQLREAISNLIGNAIKYTPTGGVVRVSLDMEQNDVVFNVTDTGAGIPQEMQAKLFQPFYRAKTLETAKIEGTGLGLYLVKGIIDRHSGTMILKSEYGTGSTFGFKLPVYHQPTA